MGKGDQRSRRGKISAGTYGKTRPKKKAVVKPVVKEKPAKKGK
jgi:30S ribosomal protein S31